MVNIGTWNFMVKLKPGKMHETADEMLKIPLQIISLLYFTYFFLRFYIRGVFPIHILKCVLCNFTHVHKLS
jgi:hypothetical protein